ncbi:hypothetical protein C8R45DRAFT_995566 [Mycena sanguinolenta]|nr:hypothetical protein C8R45DRAFT_995566 [Mycena sanguinolenta]
MDLFPTELWSEVCSHLPPEARRSLSSTHRVLYDSTRPLGFSEFTLYLYPYGFQPQQWQLDDTLERLHFWTSPQIAPHVRWCFTREPKYTWQQSAAPPKRKKNRNKALISAFFERLRRFTGLERLYAHDIQFTRAGITNLCGLPALTHLELSGRTELKGEHVDPALTLRVASFTMTLDNHIMKKAWFSVLSRDTLRELGLYYSHVVAESDVAPFPNVHTLRMNGFPDMINTVKIFSKFPNLRSFWNNYGDVLQELTPAQESSIFPILKEYTGTYLNLHIFVQRATLTRITLLSGLFFTDLITQLQGIIALPNIASLTVPFITSAEAAFGEAEIEILFSLFPNLAELQLTLIPTERGELLAQRMISFLKMLPSSPLPSTLHSFSLNWKFSRYKKSDRRTVSLPPIPDFAVLGAELIAKCPALTYIDLDGYHFLFLWRKFVREATAYTHSDAEIIRGELGRNTQEIRFIDTRGR